MDRNVEKFLRELVENGEPFFGAVTIGKPLAKLLLGEKSKPDTIENRDHGVVYNVRYIGQTGTNALHLGTDKSRE